MIRWSVICTETRIVLPGTVVALVTAGTQSAAPATSAAAASFSPRRRASDDADEATVLLPLAGAHIGELAPDRRGDREVLLLAGPDGHRLTEDLERVARLADVDHGEAHVVTERDERGHGNVAVVGAGDGVPAELHALVREDDRDEAVLGRLRRARRGQRGAGKG